MSPSPPESEDRLLRWLRALDESLAETIGDDCAFLPPAGPRAVTMDSQIAGVHFQPDLAPELLARRLLAVNLSDLAAVGARPGPAFLALSAPPEFDRRRFFRAFLTACKTFGVGLSGGDLASSPRVVLTLTLFGSLEPGSRWVRRDQGRPGDELWVGGATGVSALGRILLARGARPCDGGLRLPASMDLPAPLRGPALEAVTRHLEPLPQLELGQWLSRRPEPRGAIDLSDGLGKDLHRLCSASGVGARLNRKEIALPPHMIRLARLLGEDSELLALGGGEDYTLLFSLTPGEAPPAAWGCRKVGLLTESSEILWGEPESWEPLPDLGWDHLAPREVPSAE